MGKLDNIKKILRDDYASEFRTMVDKLANTLNPFMEQVNSAFDGNVNFENLNQEVLTVNVKVDANGTPIKGKKIRMNLKTKIYGIIVINARNLDDSSNYPTSTPFFTTTIEEQVISVHNISGLQTDEEYELNLLVIGY